MCSSFTPCIPTQYDHVRDAIAPALLREKARGKFRFLGITETSPNDPEHTMLNRAVQDGIWDTAMFAFHLMHQPARAQVFPHTRAHGVGTLMMFAVRQIFARPAQLAATVKQLAAAGQLPAWLAETDDPLGFPGACRRCQHADRRRLSLRAARAGRGRGAVRHRRSRAPAHQHRIPCSSRRCRKPTGETRGTVRASSWRRAGSTAAARGGLSHVPHSRHRGPAAAVCATGAVTPRSRFA